MKLTMLRGTARDLADHLKFLTISGQLSNKIQFPCKKDVLKGETDFDLHCVNFVKERIKKGFDFSRVRSIVVSIKRSAMLTSVKTEITVDDKVFSTSVGSL